MDPFSQISLQNFYRRQNLSRRSLINSVTLWLAPSNYASNADPAAPGQASPPMTNEYLRSALLPLPPALPDRVHTASPDSPPSWSSVQFRLLAGQVCVISMSRRLVCLPTSLAASSVAASVGSTPHRNYVKIFTTTLLFGMTTAWFCRHFLGQLFRCHG